MWAFWLTVHMIFIILGLVIAFVIGLVVIVQKQIKKIDSTIEGSDAKNENITTAQDFLPFKDIRNDMIDLGGYKYRAIIEVSSTNYGLKTETEQEIIEASFQRFLNTLQFPITMYVQTKVIDDSKMLETLKDELVKTIEDYPQFEEYAISYLDGMQSLHEKIGNNKQKKKYIIIPYDDAAALTDLTDEEKYEEAQKELMLRTSMISENIQSVGLKATLLKTSDLIELIYSIFHKDDYRNVEHILSEEFLQLIVESSQPNLLRDVKAIDKMDIILYEAQKRIRDEVFIKNISASEGRLYGAFLDTMKNMREAIKQFDENNNKNNGGE